ncbi:uncharacterized protein ATNIH1004_007350 [Aspergillus tanneri]|uniref:Uncharacterized protein n=1 Tax=Aspergillus tanneri TaxID=1220188 RepID=A0A5M9MNA1_9EURO|nr:uncharacterized protein ATNIH1004_007350 [Aspergillus tanneri]KAA8645929.1 hypothetical protein ATNIH1004_007350 [Aspergillus tanneri]
MARSLEARLLLGKRQGGGDTPWRRHRPNLSSSTGQDTRAAYVNDDLALIAVINLKEYKLGPSDASARGGVLFPVAFVEIPWTGYSAETNSPWKECHQDFLRWLFV